MFKSGFGTAPDVGSKLGFGIACPGCLTLFALVAAGFGFAVITGFPRVTGFTVGGKRGACAVPAPAKWEKLEVSFPSIGWSFICIPPFGLDGFIINGSCGCFALPPDAVPNDGGGGGSGTV